MVTQLKFNADYNNYSGVAPVQAKLLNIAWNDQFNTNLGTIQAPEFQIRFVDELDGKTKTYTIPAGNHTVSAKGPDGNGKPGQFNAELHIAGNDVNFNVTVTPGKENPIFNLTPFVGARGSKPTMVLVSEEMVVTDNVSATPAELQGA